MLRRLSLLVLCVVLFLPGLAAEEDRHLMEVSLTAGCGFYVGSFRDHLIRDGAYTATPTLDCYLSAFVTPSAGVLFQIGSGSVIHPLSEPMEGVIRYMSIGPFLKGHSGRFSLKGWTNLGFQQPDMSLEWYGSGFFEAGAEGGFALNNSNSLSLGVKYRTQFLRSIIIHEKYSLDENDNLSSVTPSLGWTVCW